ncbi:MAG: hypothetical protein M0R51_14520 [Clostridia bacterium]|jgi:hypothetical protein|nr:hypothetical protein [Clostridia bacterium]
MIKNCKIEDDRVLPFIKKNNLIKPINITIDKILKQYGKETQIEIIYCGYDYNESILLNILGIGANDSYIKELKKFNEWFIPNIYEKYNEYINVL